MKKAGVFALVLVVILIGVGGAGYYLLQNINGLVKDLIESVGSETTHTAVRVADVKISLTEGSGTLSGLTIANPAGFAPESLLKMDGVGIRIDTTSLTEDVYVISEIVIDGARVLVEQAGSSTNLQALLNGMKRDQGTSSSGGSKASNVRLAVEKIRFTNGSVNLKSDMLGERQLTLPVLTIRDIGTRDNGLTPEELGTAIANELIGEVKDAVMDQVSDLARDAARDKIKEKLSERTKEGLNKLKGLFNRD